MRKLDSVYGLYSFGQWERRLQEGDRDVDGRPVRHQWAEFQKYFLLRRVELGNCGSHRPDMG